jgi:hypothetical protein
METKQLFAAFGVLAFLGTVLLMGASIVGILGAKVIGEKRLARFSTWCTDWLFSGRGLAAKIFVVAATLILGYSATLLGASLVSQEWTLSPGAEKYFCEVDCHLAYSVIEVKTSPTVGTGASSVNAQGRFVIVTVRTRFDETTISRNRGDRPLVPYPREITLRDGADNSYPVSESGQQALTAMGEAGSSMIQPLRPGESYVSRLVFDAPSRVVNPRLLIESPRDPRWIGAVVIGDETSVLHKKIFLALGLSSGR